MIISILPTGQVWWVPQSRVLHRLDVAYMLVHPWLCLLVCSPCPSWAEIFLQRTDRVGELRKGLSLPAAPLTET